MLAVHHVDQEIHTVDRLPPAAVTAISTPPIRRASRIRYSMSATPSSSWRNAWMILMAFFKIYSSGSVCRVIGTDGCLN